MSPKRHYEAQSRHAARKFGNLATRAESNSASNSPNGYESIDSQRSVISMALGLDGVAIAILEQAERTIDAAENRSIPHGLLEHKSAISFLRQTYIPGSRMTPTEVDEIVNIYGLLPVSKRETILTRAKEVIAARKSYTPA